MTTKKQVTAEAKRTLGLMKCFHSKNPNKAVEHAVIRAQRVIKQNVATFESVLSTLKT